MSAYILIVMINFTTNQFNTESTKFVSMQEFNSESNCLRAADFIQKNKLDYGSKLKVECLKK